MTSHQGLTPTGMPAIRATRMLRPNTFVRPVPRPGRERRRAPTARRSAGRSVVDDDGMGDGEARHPRRDLGQRLLRVREHDLASGDVAGRQLVRARRMAQQIGVGHDGPGNPTPSVGATAEHHDRVDASALMRWAIVTSGVAGSQVRTPGCIASATVAWAKLGARSPVEGAADSMTGASRRRPRVASVVPRRSTAESRRRQAVRMRAATSPGDCETAVGRLSRAARPVDYSVSSGLPP